ncbi:DUF4832 domain-containing protein [Actinoplanes sp. CA-015351]|uniref:DUF4832 domain-containing protein n=1 Tax=Actinoplanes sp. CA-015351 TaxID=3239897 RepID=UPI003D9A092E
MLRVLTAATAAAAVLIPGAACAATKPASVTRAFSASTAEIANPGRGFFTYTETHLYADGTGYVPLDTASLEQARVDDAHTLVFRIFYLEKYQGTDTISAADLNRIRADFTAARAAGAKMVVRFAYTATSDADAPLARVLKHIRQLGTVLTANADIITAVQAGLIGRWGEWYYTRNFTRTDWSDRKQVLSALLAATPASVPVQVRTPQYKRRLLPDNARVGIHNDCFLADDSDYGTYIGDDRAWLAKQNILVGGETCAVSNRSGWANARAEMAAYHWTYLNPSFNADVLDSWGADGLASAARDLGYRIRLTSAVLPATTKPGVKVTARVTLSNVGYASPAANRPVKLLVGSSAAVVVPADLRTWSPGKSITLSVSFTAPSKLGSYPLSLSLPDPSARLASTPAYAIRLANDGVWSQADGTNALNTTLTVTR